MCFTKWNLSVIWTNLAPLEIRKSPPWLCYPRSSLMSLNPPNIMHAPSTHLLPGNKHLSWCCLPQTLLSSLLFHSSGFPSILITALGFIWFNLLILVAARVARKFQSSSKDQHCLTPYCSKASYLEVQQQQMGRLGVFGSWKIKRWLSLSTPPSSSTKALKEESPPAYTLTYGSTRKSRTLQKTRVVPVDP